MTIDKDGKFHTVDNPTVEVKPEDVETRIQSAAKNTTAGDTILNNVGSAIANTKVPEGTGTKQNPSFLERLEETAKAANHPNAAVNVSDLKQASDASIAKAVTDATNKGMKYAGDNYKAAEGTTAEQNGITKKLGEQLQILGGATGTLTDNNIGVNADGGALKVKLAESLTGINSITGKGGTTPLTISNGGTTLTINAPEGTKPGTISVGGAKITDVAEGTAGTDAVNVSQLNAVASKELHL